MARTKKRLECVAVVEIEFSDSHPEKEVLKMAREEFKDVGRGVSGGGYSFMLKSVKIPAKVLK